MNKNKKITIGILIVILIVIIAFVVYKITERSITKRANFNFTIENIYSSPVNTTSENNDTIKKIEESSIYKYLPKNIKSITRKSYFSNEAIDYPINDYLQFLSDFVSIEWTPTDDTIDDNYYYIIDICGDTDTHIKLYKRYDKEENDKSIDYIGFAKVYGDNFEQLYKVPSSLLFKLLSYTNDKISLYESELNEPSEEKCLNAQKIALEKMSQETIINFQNRVRNLHSYLENMLNTKTDISDPTSPYWDLYTTNNSSVEDLISKVSIGTSDELSQKVNEFIDLADISNNDTLKKDFKNAANYLEQAKTEHSRLYIYYAYQIIHDYDFFIINYPPYQNVEGGSNYAGIHTYFGKDNII